MLEDEVEAQVARIATLGDMEAQGHALDDLLRALDSARRAVITARKELVDELRAAGYSHAQVAAAIRRDRGRASQIAAGKHTGRRRGGQAADPPKG